MALKYRADIDGLRAIAVISVVLFHAFPHMFPGGFVGVDIFFVISGYLITSIITNEIRSGIFSFLNFYNRRVKRIFPSLLVVIGAVLAFGSIALNAEEFLNLSKQSLGGLLFSSNFVLWKEAGYFDVASEFKPLLHLWSLGIEEQFYIFWPLILGLCWKRKYSLTKAVFAIITISFLINILMIKNNPVAIFYLLPSRSWELAVGALLAVYFHQTSKSDSIARFVQFLIPIFLVICVFTINSRSQFPGYWATIPVLGAAMFISAGEKYGFNKFCSNSFFVWLGKLSYPLYLWHWPIFSFARITTPELSNSTPTTHVVFVFLILLSVFLADLTYRFIEKPFRKKGRPSDQSFSQQAYFLISLSLILTLLSGLIIILNGIPSRHQDYETALANKKYYFAGAEGTRANACRQKFITTSYCAIYDIEKEPTVLLIGDSLANQYYPGLSAYLAKKGENLLSLGGNATPGLYHIANDIYDDARTNDKAFELAAQNKNIKTIILSFSNYINPEKSKLKDLSGLNRNGNELYKDSLKETILFLSQHGKKIIFFLKNPQMVGFEHHQCVNTRPFRLTLLKPPPICGVKIQESLRPQQDYRRITLEVLRQFKNVEIFDPFKYLCDQDYCYAFRDKNLLYAHDDSHLSIEGSRWISQFFNF